MIEENKEEEEELKIEDVGEYGDAEKEVGDKPKKRWRVLRMGQTESFSACGVVREFPRNTIWRSTQGNTRGTNHTSVVCVARSVYRWAHMQGI